MRDRVDAILDRLGVPASRPSMMIGERALSLDGPTLTVRSPIDGTKLATIPSATPGHVIDALASAQGAFLKWRVTAGAATARGPGRSRPPHHLRGRQDHRRGPR
jgi:hypothetical protein